MTRLLNTPIIGPSAMIVASSWIDMLAGLSTCGMRRIPPDFWACAGAAARAQSSAAVTVNRRRCRSIAFSSLGDRAVESALAVISDRTTLLVHPHVFHTPAVVGAVEHRGESLH